SARPAKERQAAADEQGRQGDHRAASVDRPRAQEVQSLMFDHPTAAAPPPPPGTRFQSAVPCDPKGLGGARTGEGRKRAKERGVKFGRPRKLTPHQRQEALQRLAAGETMADVARTYAVDATTIGRLAASSPFEQSAAAL